MDSNRLFYSHSVVGWRAYGSGPEAMICFHGYGEKAETFEFLGKHAGDRYTFYAIDLPHHGDTIWNEGEMQVQQLLQIIGEICPQKSYGLMGFSLGGRVSLSLFEHNPENIRRVVLLAPDGLKVNFWYWLATQTSLGRGLFRFTMNYPGWFFLMLRLINRLGLVNSSVFKFVKHYVNDRELRELLYNRWISLRKIKPRLEMIKTKISKHSTPFVILYGRHDRIILSSVGRRFQKGIEPNCEIRIIASGHQVLHEKHVVDILAALQ